MKVSIHQFRRLALACFAIIVAVFAHAQNRETRTLSGFNTIDLAGGFSQVILQQGNTESVEIEASGIDLERIVTKVNGKSLQVGMKNGSYNNAKITLTVTYRNLEEINASGSTDIICKSTIQSKEFEYNASGSGDFTAQVNVEELEINLSGSGSIKLSGNAAKQEFAISGSGDIDAGNLKGRSADVAVSGSGDVTLNIDGKVNSSVSGSGDVTNKGKKVN